MGWNLMESTLRKSDKIIGVEPRDVLFSKREKKRGYKSRNSLQMQLAVTNLRYLKRFRILLFKTLSSWKNSAVHLHFLLDRFSLRIMKRV